MSIKKLIGKFAWTYRLPIEVSDVIAEMRDMGVTDEFNFFRDPSLPKEIVQGYVTRWFNEATGTFVTNITYAAFDDPDMERFICCKELMHVFDPENARIRSDDELIDQIKRIVLPLHLQDVITDQILTDKIAEVYAIAVLLPFNVRNMIIERYRSGSMSLDEISQKARIPKDYVKTVMSDLWINIYKRLLPGERK